MDGDAGMETGDVQVGRGPRVVYKLVTVLSGEAVDRYIKISNR